MRRIKPKEKICPVCGSVFQPVRNQKYCGAKCRTKAISAAAKERRRSAEAEIEAKKVSEWKAEREQHKGEHICYCVQCFKKFYSTSPHTLYCSESCRRIYGGKSMEYRVK